MKKPKKKIVSRESVFCSPFLGMSFSRFIFENGGFGPFEAFFFGSKLWLKVEETQTTKLKVLHLIIVFPLLAHRTGAGGIPFQSVSHTHRFGPPNVGHFVLKEALKRPLLFRRQ
jgi:hypothetical protein